MLAVGGEPEVLDRAGTGDLAEGEGAAGRDADAGGDFPTLAEALGRLRAGAFGRLPAPALGPVEVFGADRAGDGVGEAGDAAEADTEAVELVHRDALHNLRVQQFERLAP